MPLRRALRSAGDALLAKGGYRLTSLAHDIQDDDFQRLYERCKPYTMTSDQRMFGLHVAMRYLARGGVAGDVVECGVWRGGSAMLAALNLLDDPKPRHLYLYDTFTGMPKPTDLDVVAATGVRAAVTWLANETSDHNAWCYAPFDDVRANLASTGFPADRLHLIEGKVEDTLPACAPEQIALLRLDTDWYESTRHELVNLYPRLARGGVLIIDDYGHWAGSRQAVDEFFAALSEPPMLVPLDYTGRLAIKA